MNLFDEFFALNLMTDMIIVIFVLIQIPKGFIHWVRHVYLAFRFKLGKIE